MSKVQICNVALSAYLGAGRINALDEGTTEAEQCNLHFDDALEAVLTADGKHPWTFARKYAALAEVENDRTDWAHRYQLPSDCIRVIWIGANGTKRSHARDLAAPTEAPRETVGNVVYSDTPVAYIEYVYHITDVSLLPVEFRKALSAEIASLIAMPITQDNKLAANAMDAAAVLLDMAIAADEANLPPAPTKHLPDWATARGMS